MPKFVERKSCPKCNRIVAFKTNGEPYKHTCQGDLNLKCEGCGKAFVPRNGDLPEHDCTVSAPAPTVEPMDDTSPGQCPEPKCTCGGDGGPEHELALIGAFDDPTDPVTPAPEKGPWFGAMYDGRCSVSECRIYEGDRIRADGQGGYECEDCGDVPEDEPNPEQPLVEGWTCGHSYPLPGPCRCGMSPPPAPVATGTINPDLFEDPTPTAPKLNVSGQPEARRDHLKRYIVVDPDLGDFRRTVKERKPQGVTRATTFNKHAQNTIALNGWSKRNVVMGASLRPDILRRAHGLNHDNGKQELDRIVNELETAAGAKVSADEGTFLHEFCDQVDAGLKTWEDAPAMYQQDIERYVDALAKEGLEPVPGLIERTTFIREYGGVAGTFDRIFYHVASGQYIVGDLKTGKTMKYAMDETECQIWTYAHGVNQTGVYDWNTDTWCRPGSYGDSLETGPWQVPTVSEKVGVIIHMPVQGPEAGEVYLRYADLERGKAYADLNHAVKSYEKSKVRPFEMPADALVGLENRRSEGLVNPTPSVTWEHLFAAVQSRDEANELWARATEAGIGGVEMDGLVEIARTALADKG